MISKIAIISQCEISRSPYPTQQASHVNLADVVVCHFPRRHCLGAWLAFAVVRLTVHIDVYY